MSTWRVRVNGAEREVPEDTSVSMLLDALGVNRDGVAVAIDRQVVPRSQHAERRLHPDADVEVIRAVGGG